ncbi:MAG: FAD-binding oxidoreductase [Pseudomonadota bacterium]|nr:FAD-binding oxidoreductase [Pseudomonadota bacterium]
MAGNRDTQTDFSQSSGWYATVPAPGPAKRLSGRQNADWVVVGAGLTGLASARRLGELQPGARIILLESFRVGYGASGRNAGFIIDAPAYTPQFDVEYNSRLMRLFRAGRSQLETLVSHHNIDCEWSPHGHISAVTTPERGAKLSNISRSLDAVGDEYEWLDSDALREFLGTSFYSTAIRLPRTVLVNPAALCRGLGETLPANVEIYEDSPVRRVAGGEPVTVECADGSVSAKGVMLTTNVFAQDIGFLEDKLIPILLYASLSRPLNDAEQATMTGAREWGVTPGAAGGSTVRRTASNRMFLRSVVRHSREFRVTDSLRASLRETHRALLVKRYPMLSGIQMEHTWGGVVCMTRNYASAFGRIEPGVFSSIGYNGVGLARGTISGELLAEHVLGGDSELMTDAMALADPNRLPPKLFVDLGVKARLVWSRLRHRGED